MNDRELIDTVRRLSRFDRARVLAYIAGYNPGLLRSAVEYVESNPQ